MLVMIRRIGNTAVAAAAAAGPLMFVLQAGYGPLPALGRALVPGSGVWASSENTNPNSRTLTLPGLRRPAAVSFASHVWNLRAGS